jgi:hypothetical protein
MCAWVRNIALRLAPARHDLFYICAPVLIDFIRFSLSLKVIPSGTCRRIIMYQISKHWERGRNDSRSLFTRATTMRTKHSLAVGATGILAIVGLLGWTASAQAPASAPASLACDDDPPPDTNQATDPPTATPINASLLTRRLPCAEKVSTRGLFGDDALANLQRGFDFYSWLTFLALNAPADGSPIGKAKPNTSTKWEQPSNFKQLLDVMLKDGRASTWTDKKIVPPECLDQYNKLKGQVMVIEMIEESFNEPFKTGPLIDQQGNYAIFDILMNKSMFDYIQKHNLQSKVGQQSKENASLKVDFPAGANKRQEGHENIPAGDPGAVMIKVSWKVLDAPAERQNFHTVDALVLMPHDPNETGKRPCLRKTLGLVGFHVGHKTVNRRQWIWTSFEHKKNVAEQQEVDSKQEQGPYNFYKVGCDPTQCPVNQTPPTPWNPKYKNGLKFFDSKFRSQITRAVPLTDETKVMNRQFQAILGNTVWKNYMLLSTQWPSDFKCAGQKDETIRPSPPAPATDFKKEPDMNCAPAPTFLANSTLETYSQGTDPLASSSCMACHGNAVSQQVRPPDMKPEDFFNQSDFTFMLEKAQGKGTR